MEGQRKRKETRVRVIEEIVQTEKDYLQSINLCVDSFWTNKGEKVGRGQGGGGGNQLRSM